MNREDVIQLAREAGFHLYNGCADGIADLIRFASTIEKRTLERAARVCDRCGYDHEVQQGAELAFDLAAAIRALKETK